MSKHKFPYEWKLSDGYPKKNGKKVFSCFSCGGGSTMGYKLNGFDVIGYCEIDPKVAKVYDQNHDPENNMKYKYIESVKDFADRETFPDELYNLDILDGSPPCSSFSMAGNREKDWGKEKKFSEGQQEQVLDTLFFDFIKLAKKLQPKLVIAENVQGMLLGEAKAYVDKVLTDFNLAGYFVDYWLCDASDMGVPQRRKRVFFVAVRKDYFKGQFSDLFGMRPSINMRFNERKIQFSEIESSKIKADRPIRKLIKKYWNIKDGNDKSVSDTYRKIKGKDAFFNQKYLYRDKICSTITADAGTGDILAHSPRWLNDDEILKASSFPSDYDFSPKPLKWICGMSVPPVMMAQVVDRVNEYIIKPSEA